MTLDLTKLSPEDREQFDDHIREAIYHLDSCWDALFAAEVLVEPNSIETDDIQGICGEMGPPEDAFSITSDQITEVFS